MTVLRVIDFEGTGLHAEARVVEVGYVDFDPVTREISEGGGYLCGVESIPPDTRAIHHIRLEDVRGLPPYDRWVLYEEAVRAGVVGFAAHTADYEARFILGSLPLVCTYKAALRIWPDAPGHGVFALLYWLEDQGLVTYDRARAYPPHRAKPDAYATAVLLRALYDAGVEGKDLMRFTMEPRHLPRVPIGNQRGSRWEDVDYGFLRWVLNKEGSDMDPDIIWNARREIERREAAWAARREATETTAGRLL